MRWRSAVKPSTHAVLAIARASRVIVRLLRVRLIALLHPIDPNRLESPIDGGLPQTSGVALGHYAHYVKRGGTAWRRASLMV